DHLFLGRLEQVGEAGVAVKDSAFSIQRGNTLLHGLDQQSVRMVRPLQGVDPFARRTVDDDRIDRAAPDGFDRGLGFFEPSAEALILLRQFLAGLRCSLHDPSDLSWSSPADTSRPRRTLLTLAMSPMIWRLGSGLSLTSVGAATTWAFRASCGF